MTTFYLGALALTIFSLVFTLWPYFRRPQGQSLEAFTQERQATNVSSFRDHLAELESQFKQGNIEQEQYEETKAELERSLLHDNSVQVDAQSATVSANTKRLYWILAFIVLPVMVFVIYQQLGFKDSVLLGEKLALKNSLEEQWFRTGDESIELQLRSLQESLLVDLDRHVKKHPDDLDTHVLLAREAMSVGLYDKAIETYQTILEQQPEAAQMMAELAQAIFIQAGNRAVPVVGILAERAIQIQPDHVMALGLVGISAFQNADYSKAIVHWERAIALQPQDSANARALINGIAQAKSRLTADDAQPPVAQAQAAAPLNENDAAAPSLTVSVALDKNVVTTPDAAVFIYARAWQGAKIPLAISRVTVNDLPLTINLDNTMSMAPGMNLSTATEVEIIARVSASGTAIAQAGDWQASVGPVVVTDSAEKTFNLLIDTPYSP